jgi:hypothetical protein
VVRAWPDAGGRFFWASLPDYIGRRIAYVTFVVTQVALFLLIPRPVACVRENRESLRR